MCCSSKCVFYFRAIIVPIFFFLNGVTSAINFKNEDIPSGVGFAIATVLLLLFWVMVLRLGHKPIREMIYDEMDKQNLIQNSRMEGNVINQTSIPYEMRAAVAEQRILEKKTIFRRFPSFFIWTAVLVVLAALGVSGYYLKIAITSHAKFNPFEAGNEWIPFIAFMAICPPCFDIIGVSRATRHQVREYIATGGVDLA